jgi:phosphocarrier protein
MSDDNPASSIVREIRILNKKGLHARASAKFVQCVERFGAEVEVTKDGQSVNGTSIMGLMMLAAGIGSTIEVSATGSDAEAVIEALAHLIADRFGEGE